MRKAMTVIALATAGMIAGVSSVAAQGNGLAGYGVVLMHGKGGQPGGPIASLAAALQSEGAVVIAPRMARSGSKGHPDKYDVTYEQSLSQIDRAIE